MKGFKGAETSGQRRASNDPGAPADVAAGILLIWRSRTGGEITAEEARQAVENVSGFFSRLALWEEAQG
jgi:hypothetical protein